MRDRKLLTHAEVGDVLGRSRDAVRTLIDAGKVSVARLNPRVVRVRPHDLSTVIDSHVALPRNTAADAEPRGHP